MIKSKLKKHFFIISKFLIIFALAIIYFFVPYEVMYGSDVKKYIILQNELSTDLSSFFKYLFNFRFDGPLFFFTILIYKILLSIDVYVQWEKLFIFINLLSFFSIFLITSKILEIKDNLSFILFTILFWFNLEYFSWNFYTLTDIIFSLLIVSFLFYLINNSKIIFFIILLIIFFRSTSVILFLFLFQYFFVLYFFKNRINLSKIILLVLFFNFLILFLSSLGYNYLDLGDNQLQEKINFFKERLSRGVVIDDRPETYLSGKDSTFYYFKIMTLRYIYFFAPYAQDFSLIHKLYNISYFSIIYILIIYCLFNFKKNRKKEQMVIVIMILFITSFALFHSIYLIDYDWRYRMPTYVPMLIISFFGYKLFFNRYIKNLLLK